MSSSEIEIESGLLPRHVAIIMDGNGRWAKERGQERLYGHHEGVDSVDKVIEAATEMGIEYITMYAFSTENWNRPTDEVDGLMDIFAEAMTAYIGKILGNNVRLLIIGDIDRLNPVTRKKLDEGVEATAKCTGLTMILCISYSSRWEMIRGIKRIAQKVADGEMKIDDINDETFSAELCTAGIPDPDLLIRTSGELRISNFLMWQLSYTELYFTDVCWPDFKKEHFRAAIADYQHRQRRFGKTGEQVTK